VLDVDRVIVVNDLSYANYDEGIDDWVTIEQVLTENTTLNFFVDAIDYDGNDLEFSWSIDGDIVSTLSSFDFISNDYGNNTYNIELYISDNFRDIKTYNWSIQKTVSIIESDVEAITTSILSIYPNPFNPTTTIKTLWFIFTR